MFRSLILLVLSAALAAGCGRKPELIGGQDVTVIQNIELPAPTEADYEASLRPYRIGPLDKLAIDVYGIEDLKREVQIDSGGRVSFPLVGYIEAAGRTPEELANEIEAGLSGFVRDPIVTVNLQDSVSRVVTVEGAVREPGIYPMLGKMTLIQAIASAKGVTDVADLQHAVVFRTVGNQRFAALYSVRAIREGRYADPELYPNDVVLVGESGARRTFRDLLQAAPLLTAPLIAVLQSNTL